MLNEILPQLKISPGLGLPINRRGEVANSITFDMLTISCAVSPLLTRNNRNIPPNSHRAKISPDLLSKLRPAPRLPLR